MQLFKKIFEALRTGFHTLLPTCREAARIQSAALDRPLTPAQRFGLRLHLLVCKWCRRYGRQIRFLGRAAHDHADKLAELMPQNLSPDARERIKRRLHVDRNE